MKKLYFIITLLFTVLLASCSQEEPVNGETDNSRVSISAELPGDIAATRAQITIPTTHKLRCIIEVWTKSDSPFLKYREEIAVAAGTVPTFDFPLRPGDYTCLMWADFIAADATVSEVTSVDGVTYTHFEDTYYDTSNLHQLTVKDEFASNLFDTDLCDGFYAKLEVKKNAAAVNESMKLTRPFAKLIVQETDAEKFATLTGLTVSFEMPKTFSVATGEPGAEMLTAVYDKNFASAEDAPQILYTGYVFTPSTGLSLGSSILTFTTAAGKSTREIPGESIELKRNQQMTAGGKLMGDGALDPGTDPDPEPSKDPQVGDYFFIDGTWSSELTEENTANCVGIVYAVGAQGGDDISNYPNSEGKSIKGDEKALKILRKVGETFNIPTVTDIHETTEAAMAAEYVDVLQIPAFLCRQTDLLVAAAETGKIVNIKKGQFLSPGAMQFAVQKVVDAGNDNVMITERGTTFGYTDLVVDFRGIPQMQTFGFPVIMDVTHSLQQPNQTSGVTGGLPALIETIAKAAIAVGTDGLFIETHPEPSQAKSDGANMLRLDLLEDLLTRLVRLRQAIL